MGERERVAMLARVLGRVTAARGSSGIVRLGIGDDCAVLNAPTEGLVLSVDSVVEHVHFRRAWLTFEQLGYRATMGALSDLAAMGAVPLGVLSSLILPDDVEDDVLEELARGQAEACAEVGTSVVGGNLSRGGELSITTTVIGDAPEPLRRDGARVGDVVVAAGPLGLAAAGLRVLLDGPDRADEEALAAAVGAWRRPRARIAEGLRLRGVATAAIDVSDGLGLDVSRVAEASECCVVLEEERIVTSALAAAAAGLGLDAVALALEGGEDYAVVATVPPGSHVEGFVAIGRCEAGEGVELEGGGRRRPVPSVGWDHFAPPEDG